MIYVNLDQPYEDAVQNLKRIYAIKGNQTLIEHLVRQEAIRLGVWSQPIPQSLITNPQSSTHEVSA